ELLAPRGEAPVDSRHHGVARLLVVAEYEQDGHELLVGVAEGLRGAVRSGVLVACRPPLTTLLVDRHRVADVGAAARVDVIVTPDVQPARDLLLGQPSE